MARPSASPSNDFRVFPVVSDAIDIPIMIQDAPVAGHRSRPTYWRGWQGKSRASLFQDRGTVAAAKLRDLIALGGDVIEGPWDGEEGITLMADLEAGATGAMTGAVILTASDRSSIPIVLATATRLSAYERWLPLINYENRQCGLQACKSLMKEGGVIGSEAVRHPLQKVHPATRAGLIEIARRLDPVVLRWGR